VSELRPIQSHDELDAAKAAELPIEIVKQLVVKHITVVQLLLARLILAELYERRHGRRAADWRCGSCRDDRAQQELGRASPGRLAAEAKPTRRAGMAQTGRGAMDQELTEVRC
jgi:hypothetical protein